MDNNSFLIAKDGILQSMDDLFTSYSQIYNNSIHLINEVNQCFQDNKIYKIGYSCFKHCEFLEDIDLPFNTLKQIGEYSFAYCYDLKKIRIDLSTDDVKSSCISDEDTVYLPPSLERVEEGAFYECFSIQNVVMLGGIYIGKYAFSRCGNLRSISLPDSIQRIDDGCFARCSSMEEIELPDNLKEISNRLFYMCSGLEWVMMPCSVLKIGDESFRECISLKGMFLPDTVKEIGTDAFSYCTRLKEISIHTSIEKIMDNAFKKCYSIKEISINYNTYSDLLSFILDGNIDKIVKDSEEEKIKITLLGLPLLDIQKESLKRLIDSIRPNELVFIERTDTKINTNIGLKDKLKILRNFISEMSDDEKNYYIDNLENDKKGEEIVRSLKKIHRREDYNEEC